MGSKSVFFNECLIFVITFFQESVRQKELTRFYLQKKENVSSSNVALFVGNLPPNLAQRQYEKILVDKLGKRKSFNKCGPVFILLFQNFQTGCR